MNLSLSQGGDDANIRREGEIATSGSPLCLRPALGAERVTREPGEREHEAAPSAVQSMLIRFTPSLISDSQSLVNIIV